MVDRLLDAVRGAFPDMADIVASTLRLQFGAVLLPVLTDAQRFQFLALAADDPDGPESLAMAGVEPDAAFDALPPSGQMRAGLDMAMAAYGTPVPTVDDLAVADAAARRALSNRLDVALNGAAGATGASLVSLVKQVERQQRAVHIVNFDDGMVINFRAPDGQRATLTMGPLLRTMMRNGDAPAHVLQTMCEAIAAYPSVGPRMIVQMAGAKHDLSDGPK